MKVPAAGSRGRLLLIGAVLAYPVAVFFLLGRLDALWLGALLMALLAMRGALLLRDAPRIAAAGAVAGATWLVLLVLDESTVVLKLYPALISLGLLLGFGYTLLRPPSMAERIARRLHMEINAAGIGYTRAVTAVWCAFFAANAILSAAITLQGSLRAWVFYNGFLSYVLTFTLFAAEYLYRQSFRRRARLREQAG